MKYKGISAVILAGGHSTRMGGSDKAMLCVEGKPILERSISVLGEIFEELVIVTNDTRAYNYGGVKVVKDKIKDIGPLGGIYTGLCNLTGNSGFFVGCDMPFLHNGIIHRQVDFFNLKPCDVFVPKVGSLIEPLHAIYKKALKDRIPSFLKDGKKRSIKEFLKTIDARYLELDDTDFNRHCFKNVNTPEELRDLQSGISLENQNFLR